ncbi:family 10 glycosylhydrolase [Candidatus Viridilinea mediisalina]|nr:family 10 glycosylhydrolase [Candidatus Viridilinea mediisalina]
MRHGFVALLIVVVLLAGLAPPPSVVQAQEAPIQQMRAFWVDSFNPGFYNHAEVDELVENVVRAGANTIIMQVRRHGDAWYNNAIEPRALHPRLAPAHEFDPLAYLIEKAHSRGVRVHAWLVLSVTCRRADALWGHPEHVCTHHGPDVPDPQRWTTATFGGVQVGDFDFGHPAAVLHLERVVQHLLWAYPELDGIHWDYIRFGGQSYGYNRVSIERFNLAHGRPLHSRPQPADPEWSQWRRDRVTELARRLYIRAKAIKPTIEVSAATITWGGLGTYSPHDWPNSSAYRQVFQDWPAWLEEGIIDVALPMQYFAEGVPRSREWYNGWLNFSRNHTGRRAVVVGLGSWLNTREQNIAQIQRAHTPDEHGRVLSGVAFFSYDKPFAGSNFHTRREFMDQLRATVFAQPAQAPDWPWIANPTHGMLQGIAEVDGAMVPDARVTLIHNGEWLRDIHASADGWYGAVELPPGEYTIIVTHPDGRQQSRYTVVQPGLVSNL